MTRVSSRKNKRSSQASAKTSGQIRIIAGQWRGRKLKVLDSEGLRPTTDRMKETLFNWLMPYIYQARCLDLFAGSGSLSFESLSRQAEHITMLERDKQAAAQLKHNLHQLDLSAEQAQLINQDSLQWLQQAPAQAYDIVYIDPPFHQGLVNQACQQLSMKCWLADNALIYIEQEQHAPALSLPPGWVLLKQKQVGQVESLLFQISNDQE